MEYILDNPGLEGHVGIKWGDFNNVLGRPDKLEELKGFAAEGSHAFMQKKSFLRDAHLFI